jgi:hypothetical protein
MRPHLTLPPDQDGAKQLRERYGDCLVCVRYRYDEVKKQRWKTIELIIEKSAWKPPKPKVASRYPGSYLGCGTGARGTAASESRGWQVESARGGVATALWVSSHLGAHGPHCHQGRRWGRGRPSIYRWWWGCASIYL